MYASLTLCAAFLLPTLFAEAIPVDDKRLDYVPRLWTLPGDLTPEEQAQRALDAIKPIISDGLGTIPTIIVTPPQPIDTILPTPVSTTATGNIATIPSNVITVKALEKAGPTPNQRSYQQKYKELQLLWKTQVSGKNLNAGYHVFFEQDNFLDTTSSGNPNSSGDYANPAADDSAHQSVEALSSGNLTSNALQALMLRYLNDNADINISLSGVNVAMAFVTPDPDNAIRLDDALINSVLLTPARDAFTKQNNSIYSAVIQLKGAGKGQYVSVVIDKRGNVSLIDTAIKEKTYATTLLTHIIASLNKQRLTTDLIFVAADSDPIVYTGLQGADADNTRSGLYAFAYWAAFMKADTLDAYKRVNGAASEETNVLSSYDSLNLCSVYSKTLSKTTGYHDSNAYELDLRAWLRTQVSF